MSISQLARSIVESPTLRLNEEARLLRERGEPVIHLGIGEPKNKAPISAILASAAKLVSGDVKYAPTDGLPSLKKAILRYTEEFYDRVIAPENVIVSEGAKQSLFNILYTLCNAQDEVIVLAPYWVSYPEIVKMVQAVPVIVTPEDGSFVPRFEEVERAASSSTKALILNSPNNPSGAVFPEELVAKLVDWCERKGIWLIVDDIYHKLVFDGKVAAPAWRFTSKDVESSKVIVVNGVSKLYGMTGFRIGWVAANRELVRIMTNVQAQTTSCVPTTSQAAAEGALTGLQSYVESLRLTIQNNRDVLMQEIRTFQGVKLRQAGGDVLCASRFPFLPDGLGGALEPPPQEGDGRDGPGEGVRDGGAPPPLVCGHGEGDHGGDRPDEVGDRPRLAERDLDRRAEAREGLAVNNLLDIRTPAEAQAQALKADFGLAYLGLSNLRKVYWNLPTEALYEEIVFRGEAKIAHAGPIIVDTGTHTARAASDKFVVREADSEGKVWWGVYNRPLRAGQVRRALRTAAGLRPGAGPFRAGLLRGRRPRLPASGPDRHRAGVALALRPQHVPASRRRTRSTGGTSRSSP